MDEQTENKKETLLQKVNPYYGSWEYFENNPSKKIRSYLEIATLMVSPGGGPYIAGKLKEKIEEYDYSPSSKKFSKIIQRALMGFEFGIKIPFAGVLSYITTLL